MIKLKFLIILLMFNLSLMPNLHAQEEVKTAIVMGRITTVDGSPIVNATVSIGDKFDFTDVNGRFRIKGVPFGTHTMKVTKKGSVLIEEKVWVNSPLMKDVNVDDIDVVELQIADLKDRNPYIRRETARVLGEIKDPRAVEPLIAALKKDEDRDVRKKAVLALGERKDPRIVEILIAALKNEYWRVRSEAAEALVKQGKPAVQPLIDTLKDEDNKIVQWVASEALREITGQEIGEDPAKWQEWWEKNKEKSLKKE